MTTLLICTAHVLGLAIGFYAGCRYSRTEIIRPALAAEATIECPTCLGDGNDITGIYEHCMNCDGTGRLSASRTDAENVAGMVS